MDQHIIVIVELLVHHKGLNTAFQDIVEGEAYGEMGIEQVGSLDQWVVWRFCSNII